MENLYARREKAREIREREARNAFNCERVEQQANDDEVQFPSFLANFYKTLPQDDRGFVDAQAYRLLLRAINSGESVIFEEIPQDSHISDQDQRTLANPQAALAFVLEGPDPSAVTLPPAPDFESQETAAEMVELYWMALLRDIPFTEYDSNSDVFAAVEELNTLEGVKGPKSNGQVTPKTLFRGNVPGSTIGPLVPQFYLRESPFNTILISLKQRTFPCGMDYMTTFDDFLEVQRGLNRPLARIILINLK